MHGIPYIISAYRSVRVIPCLILCWNCKRLRTFLLIIIQELKNNLRNPKINSQLRILMLNVPFRFLRPWIDTSDNKDMIRRSQFFENGCLYSIHKESTNFYIDIDSKWDSYLHNHYSILVDFTYWNLIQFLQVRNPNVPAISNKIVKPIKRDSLYAQHRYWDMILNWADLYNVYILVKNCTVLIMT